MQDNGRSTEVWVAAVRSRRGSPRRARHKRREERTMRTTTGLLLTAAAIALAAIIGAPSAQVGAQQTVPAGLSIGDSDLGGVVTSAKGPEAGVWVIAETHDLPTRLIKIVVTDDQGRYVLPELPKA